MTRHLFNLNPEKIDNAFISENLDGYEVPEMPYLRMRLLAVLAYISGIDKKNENGEFYLSNRILLSLSGFRSEDKLITALRKLAELGLITRRSGGHKHPCFYRVTLKVNAKCTVEGKFKADSRKGSLFKRGVKEEEKLTCIDLMKEKEIKERDNSVEHDTPHGTLREQCFASSPSTTVPDTGGARMQESPQTHTHEAEHTHDLNEDRCAAATTVASNNDTYLKADARVDARNGGRSNNLKEKKGRKSARKVDYTKWTDYETFKKKRECSSLLSKLNNRTYTSSDLARLYELRKEGLMTVKQKRMFYVIRKHDGASDITAVKWRIHGNCPNVANTMATYLIEEYIIGDGYDLKAAMDDAMMPLREYIRKECLLISDKNDGANSIIRNYYEDVWRVYSRLTNTCLTWW